MALTGSIRQESDETENYMAHAVRAFFDNGGSRLYVSRVYASANPDQFVQDMRRCCLGRLSK